MYIVWIHITCVNLVHVRKFGSFIQTQFIYAYWVHNIENEQKKRSVRKKRREEKKIEYQIKDENKKNKLQFK